MSSLTRRPAEVVTSDKNSVCVRVCVRALRHCEEMIQRYRRDVSRSSSGSSQPHCSVGKAVQDCMRAIIGVLLNLTHDNGELETRSVCTGRNNITVNNQLHTIVCV